MATPEEQFQLTADQWHAITVRDEQARDGVVISDYEVFRDRHLLIQEVLRLNELVARLQSGRPTNVKIGP